MKTLILPLFVFCFSVATAQKKKLFFDDIYFSGMAGNEVFHPELSQWKNMYADRTSIPYFLDTMKADIGQSLMFNFNINAKGAFAIMASKQLINNAKGWLANKKIEWRTGLYYKQSVSSPSQQRSLSDFNYPADTSGQYVSNRVKLKQEKQILEWQNLINFKTGSFLNKKVRFNIGSGIGISSTIKNTIHETYWQAVYTWNSSSHNFLVQTTPVADNNFKAKTETNFSYVLYLGTELNLSKKLGLLSDFHYTISNYKYSTVSPKIESYWFGLTLCYHLNQ